MKNTEIVESGVVGVEIRLTVQEMIVLADLKKGLEYALEQTREGETIMHESLAKNLRTILHKMVGEVKGMEETYEDLFNEE